MTDEDLDKSDDETTASFKHFLRRILAGEAEIMSLNQESPMPLPFQLAKRNKSETKSWKKEFTSSTIPQEFLKTFGPEIEGYLNSIITTPADAFLSLLPPNLIEIIIEQSHVYAVQHGKEMLFCPKMTYYVSLVFCWSLDMIESHIEGCIDPMIMMYTISLLLRI